MNLASLLAERAAAGRPVRMGLIGAGKFGSMILAQAQHVEGLHVVGVVDLDVGVADVREPVYYGPDATAALDLVRDMRQPRAALARMSAASAERALVRLRDVLAAHETGEGVLFGSSAWLVTARRAER